MSDTAEDLLHRAATPAWERIDRDRGRADEESDRVLAFIRRHLFDPRLDVGWMLARLELSHNASSRFRARIGIAPRRYVEGRRLEAARRLLRDTDLEVRKIGELVGYRRFAAFSHAFKRRVGRRPKAYREARPPAARSREVIEPLSEARPPEPIPVDDETQEAAQDLARHYGCSISEAVRHAVYHLHSAVVGTPQNRRRETAEAYARQPDSEDAYVDPLAWGT